jgi:2-isopropylmalate synthase
LGLATANTLAGIQAGADIVEVTINGIGERAGNCALEEVAASLFLHHELFNGAYHALDMPLIDSTSKLVALASGIPEAPNKAIVGLNAFGHEAGIHQDGVLKDPETYEIIPPELVGSTSKLILGRHSGRKGLKARLEMLGYSLDSEQLERAYAALLRKTEAKKILSDDDLEEIVQDITETVCV